jgi:ketosteroid isomerase-like protein
MVLVAIAPLAARAQDRLLASAGDLGASPSVAEIRVVAGPANAAIEQELRSADRTLIQAIAASDRLAAARLLDPEFTWIDRDGRSRTKSDLLNWIVLLSAGPDANITLRNYGRVALLTGTHRLTPDNAPALFVRVWVRQTSGWHLLLYQETAPADSSAPSVSSPKDARYRISRDPAPPPCDNPCRSLPYKPLSSDAQEIVASFMAGEKAVFDGDADAASRILGDDVLFVTPERAQPADKAQRIAALRNFRHGGQAESPPEVASMALWVFGNAAVMAADQESPQGEMLRATRIWAKRDGQWQLAFSQQTPLVQ